MTKNTCLKTSTGIMCYATPSYGKKVPIGSLDVGDRFRYPSDTAGGVSYKVPFHQKVVKIEKEENTMDKSLHQIKGSRLQTEKV